MQVCSRCIVDTTVPNVHFDSDGVCNYCHLHDKMESQFPLNESGEERLNKILSSVREKGKYQEFDCVIGISGGRDSMYTLLKAKRDWGLRPLAVHFNDGFGNPVAGENMQKGSQKLGVELRTITSDWRESKDIKIAFLKASTADLEEGTDVGIASSLYGVACKENIKTIIIGQSFRTEGIMPLEWNYLDGYYMNSIHKKYGSVPIRKWRPDDPGFNLNALHMFYYTVLKGIKVELPLYYTNYVRKDVDKVLEKELDWVNTGAHYFDDLYQSLMAMVYRKKFNIDRRKINYSALIRSGQMQKEDALEKVKTEYVIEDPKVINLCIKRLGLSEETFNEYMQLEPKTFRDFPNTYNLICKLKWPIKLFTKLRMLPESTYDKYFTLN